MLVADQTRLWVVDAMQKARQELDFDIWAYVIMPEHVHLLIRPRQKHYKMAHILAALKRSVSKQAKDYLLATGNNQWLERLTVRKGEKRLFRFWLPGGGFDRNLCQGRPIEDIIDYMHANPERRGLVQQPTDWIWSSARFWDGDDSVPVKMDLPELG